MECVRDNVLLFHVHAYISVTHYLTKPPEENCLLQNSKSGVNSNR